MMAGCQVGRSPSILGT